MSKAIEITNTQIELNKIKIERSEIQVGQIEVRLKELIDLYGCLKLMSEKPEEIFHLKKKEQLVKLWTRILKDEKNTLARLCKLRDKLKERQRSLYANY